ncbi:MAG: hypothetical protein A3H79_02315 [Candidatus Levybacteria bacterium RIFCSPLOWO2_02_FULL_36_8b]|nr:MAG: hypothetical protein A3H79_02315 [Candidatus Levybacteria bacterium RIFCSPLOWO2_02_FULL_36_8b]
MQKCEKGIVCGVREQTPVPYRSEIIAPEPTRKTGLTRAERTQTKAERLRLKKEFLAERSTILSSNTVWTAPSIDDLRSWKTSTESPYLGQRHLKYK